MSYSYQNPMPISNGMPYGNQKIYVYNGEPKSNTTKAVVTGTVAGASIGAVSGYLKNPLVSKTGTATDSFAKNVYETYIKKGSNPLQKTYEQGNEILKNIDKTKTVSELKDLFNSNKEAANSFCNELKVTIDEYFKNITDNNLTQNKDIIKEKINASNKLQLQNIKNDIQACWKQKNKTFEKAANVSQELFESIKEASKGTKTKTILKYTAIAAVIGASVAFIANKLINSAKNSQSANQNQVAQQ